MVVSPLRAVFLRIDEPRFGARRIFDICFMSSVVGKMLRIPHISCAPRPSRETSARGDREVQPVIIPLDISLSRSENLLTSILKGYSSITSFNILIFLSPYLVSTGTFGSVWIIPPNEYFMLIRTWVYNSTADARTFHSFFSVEDSLH